MDTMAIKRSDKFNALQEDVLSKENFPTLEEFRKEGLYEEGLQTEHEKGDGLRVAVAQINTYPSRLKENAEKILEYARQADESGADVVVFPELALPGYSNLDNFRKSRFIRANIDTLKEVVRATKGMDVTLIVGFADQGEKREDLTSAPNFYNSAAIIRDGKLIDIVDKSLLPHYDIFWDPRYFKVGRQNEPVKIKGQNVGIQICEDGWGGYSRKISEELKGKGADVIVNLSASPFEVGKSDVRKNLTSETSGGHGVPMVYCNLVGAQDGYQGEIIFDGRSMVHNADGELVHEGGAFEEGLYVVDLDKAEPVEPKKMQAVEEVHDALVLGIKDYFKRCGFKRAYVGNSGGIDSAVVLALAAEALGPENVTAVTMPSHITSDETLGDAMLLSENLGMECLVRPIGEQFQAWKNSAAEVYDHDLQSITPQNIQARIRGKLLMEMTNEDRGAIVLSTGNKTEVALGYCTLYGDMCGGLAVIADVNKLMVYDVARYINERAGKEVVPDTIITRPPTAELEEGQVDADNLPADYDVLSPLVEDIVERDLTTEELYERYPQEVVDRTIRLVQINEYKRRQAAPAIRVTGKAFGSGRRYPIDNRFY